MAYKQYKKRWFLLLVVSLLNFSNAMTWITFAPITYYTNIYYGNDNAATIYNVIFMALSIPLGILAMWGVDKFGIRPICIIGSLINLIGNLLRVLGSAPFITSMHWRFWIVAIGQTCAASAQPFIMYLPTKLAALWFAEDQRVIANTISSMSNPLGVAVMYALSPVFVNETHPDWFIELTSTVCALAVVTCVLSFGVTSSRPKTPPSSSSEQPSPLNFWKSIKQMFRNRAFLVLLLAVGSAVGLFNCLYNNLQPTLCSRGYSNKFTGLIGFGMILIGIAGAAIFGLIVDRTKKFLLIYKLCLVGTALSAISLAIAFGQESSSVFVAISVLSFGFFGFPTYPLGLELAVETTYPIPEATASGSLICTGQILGILYIVLTGELNRQPSEHLKSIQTCVQIDKSIEVFEWQTSSFTWSGIVVLTAIFAIALFWPTYKRIEHENAQRVNQPEPYTLTITPRSFYSEE
ncbi:hypothetical protein M3Y97_00889000 [Aphelenchoides bicaudatus]|nr:hypothetical protein M3Y97_00889000 [Aphelenchoides bicaudatus]